MKSHIVIFFAAVIYQVITGRNLVKMYLCGLWWGSCHISDELNRCILSDWQLTLQIYVDSWDQFCHNSRFPIESVWLIMEFQLLWSKVVRLCANNQCSQRYYFLLLRWHLQLGKLLEGFKILCTDFDHILEKKGGTIQGGIFYKEGY